VKIVADTNLLVRALTEDDPKQSRAAQNELRNAEIVAIGNAALCELVWVLSRVYRISNQDTAKAIRALLGSANVVVDSAAADAGLSALDDGGDFADGIIAFEGRQLGGETFVSFDKKANKRLEAQGMAARSPS
jgi:predicted nucleic-acid-binding protein